MVACRWRMQRLRLIETALIDSEMDRELPAGETPEDPGYQLAFAFRRLVDESRAISLASRYESRLHRIHERTHRTLRELQQSRTGNPSVSTGSPEPTPASVSTSSLPVGQVRVITSKSTRIWPENTMRIPPTCTVARSIDVDRSWRTCSAS